MPLVAQIHVAAGLIALGSGAVIFFNIKGTQFHRIMGYVYVIAMVALNATALTIYRLFGYFGPFHVLAVLSLMSVAAGFVPAFRKKPRNWMVRHFGWMCGSYVGLAAATASEIVVRVPPPGFFHSRLQFFGFIIVASSTVGTIGAFLIKRYARTAFSVPGR